MDLHDLLGGVAAGLAGGFSAGLLGVSPGGGLVVFSVLLLGAEQHVAQGISLVAQIPPTGVAGIRRYWERGGRSPLRWLVILSAGFVAGGIAGAYGASRASSSVLQWSDVAYLLGLDAMLIARGARKAPEHGEIINERFALGRPANGRVVRRAILRLFGNRRRPCHRRWLERCAGGSAASGATDQSRPFTYSNDPALSLGLLETRMVVVVGCARRRDRRPGHRHRPWRPAREQNRSVDASRRDDLFRFAHGCLHELQSSFVMQFEKLKRDDPEFIALQQFSTYSSHA